MATETPMLDVTTARRVCQILSDRLTSLLDMQLTLKHVHWNIVGPNFIAVHRMVDRQVKEVRAMSDVLAERIAALGGVPLGTPAAIVEQRRWPDYKINRAPTQVHLAELESVYSGIIDDHRRAMADLGELDLVSQDTVMGQTAQLEQLRWLIRTHLASDGESEPTTA